MSADTPSVDKDLPRGNSRRYRLTVVEPQSDTTPPPRVPLTGCLIIFEMKRQPEPRRLSPTDDEVVVRKTSDDVNEIEILDQLIEATKGQCVIKIVPADTEFLAPGTYAYSIDVTTAVDEKYTVTRGRIFLKGPATAAENLTPP